MRALDRQDSEEPCTDPNSPLLEAGQRRSPMVKEEATEDPFRRVQTYWLSRVVVWRAQGFVYLVAFLVSAFQNKALLGEQGIDPKPPSTRPTPAFALLGWGDLQLDLVAFVGILLSGLMLVSGLFTWIIPLCLWLLYLSIVNLQSSFVMGYGWEWQVLETGFLVIFLFPIWSRTPFPKHFPPNFAVLCLLRWLAFRVMFGTGMSKMGAGASPCWRELSCTMTHYETQPNPNGMAWFMHHLPSPVHRLECAIALFVELVAPFLMFAPWRNVRLVAGIIPTCFMFIIIATGNYAYINWITLVPFAAFFDDAFLAFFFSKSRVKEAREADAVWAASPPMHLGPPGLKALGGSDFIPLYSYFNPPEGSFWTPRAVERALHLLCSVALVIFIMGKSMQPFAELFSPSPWLQFYDDYFFVNAYGVFGFINKYRYQLALESSRDGSTWQPLEFPCYPGSVDRTPCFITPYHYRADWEAWIETTASWEQAPVALYEARGAPVFMEILLTKVMAGDTQAAALLGSSLSEIFGPENTAPKMVRSTLYLYTFSDWKDILRGIWWHREEPPGSPGALVMDRIPLKKEEVSQLPPTRDWSLLLSTLGIICCLSCVLQDGLANHSIPQHVLYSLFGPVLLITVILSQFCSIATWKAFWGTFIVLGAQSLMSLWMSQRLKSVKAVVQHVRLSPDVLSQTQSSIAAAVLLVVFMVCFVASLLGFHMLVVGVTALVALVQSFAHGWLGRHAAVDGLFVAVTCVTLSLSITAFQAGTFRPPRAL